MYNPLSSLMEFDAELLKATIDDLRRDFKLCVSESEDIGDETHCYGNFAEVVGFMHWHMLAPYGASIYHGVSEKYNDDVFSTENIQKYDLTEALAVFGKVLYTERYHGNLTYSLCEDGVMAELLEQFYGELVKFQSKPMNKIKKIIAEELWGKTDGRTYKHYVQSYHEDEEITPEQAHKNAVELAEHTKAWKGHEVLIATHIDKGHIHTHFIVNSVNYENGHKLQWM